jgi:Ca-activated chloride channel family protein
MTRKLLLLTLLLVVAPAARLHAEGALGRLEGRVSDAGGSPLAGVAVTATYAGLRLTRSTSSGADGRYALDGLQPGAWQVTFQRGGFAPSSHTVTVIAGQTARAMVTLAAAPTPAPKPVEKEEPARLERKKSRGPLGDAAATMPAPATPVEPDEDFDTEQYDRIDDNPFHRTTQRPLSTFSIDVDTASYANVRRFLREERLPPRDAVRIEELLNYFRYDYAPPKGDEPFSITTEVGPSPFNARYQLVHVGLQSKAIDARQVPARNLVFLIDVSGSMQPANKLPLLKQAMALLVEQLRPQDRVALVVYAGSSGLVLPSTAGDRKDQIQAALAMLEAGGSTNGAEGIVLAYQVAQQHFIKGGINRVILCTDGDFNVGVTSDGELTRLIEDKRKSGVFLTVLGFGMGNLKDSRMEKLADRGNGNYAYLDGIEEARKVLVREAGATLVTVAKDVKLQIEFNPVRVAGYRLVGYENRLLRDEDFNDDAKDAGEIGAGHSVTALYEIVPVGQEVPGGAIDDLRYQKRGEAAPAAGSQELMTVKVRYKAPDGDASKLTSRAVLDARRELAQTSNDFRFSAAVAGFGMLLRDTPIKTALTWARVEELARGAVGSDVEGYRRQFLTMIGVASRLASRQAIAR